MSSRPPTPSPFPDDEPDPLPAQHHTDVRERITVDYYEIGRRARFEAAVVW